MVDKNNYYISDMVLYREIVQRVFDDGLYSQLYNFFATVLLSTDYDIKLFMARKCYCLLKVFKPIFEFEDLEKYKGKFENVMNDRSLLFRAKEINKKSKILIIDDTMKFGRTVAKTIDTINSVFEMPKENISICVFAVLNTFLEEAKESNFAYFKKENEKADEYKFIYKNTASCASFSENTTEISVFGKIYFCSEYFVNKLTVRFIEAIHAVGESYSGYSPYFFMPLKDIGEADLESTNKLAHLKEILKNNLKGYTINSITVPEQKNNGVYAFLLRGNDEYVTLDGCLYSGIRLSIHTKLKRATVTPLVIIPDLKVNEAYAEFTTLTGYKIEPDDRIPKNSDERTTIKYNSILYACDYILSQRFISNVMSLKDSLLFETEISHLQGTHYPNGDFQCSTTEAILNLDINKKYDFSEVFKNIISQDEEINVDCNLASVDNSFNESVKELAEEQTHNVFDILSLFFYKLVVSDLPLFAKSGRYPISLLHKKVMTCFGGKLEDDSFFVALVKTIELGMSGTKIFSAGNRSYSFIQEGEASGESRAYIHVKGLHTSFEMLVDILEEQSRDSAEFEKHLKNIRECYRAYLSTNFSEDNGEQIGIVQMKQLLNAPNISECNFSSETFSEIKTDNNIKYFTNFMRYYLGYMPDNLACFKSELLKHEELESDSCEKENIELVLEYIPST